MKQMYTCRFFSKDYLEIWENFYREDKTWGNLQEYFIKKYESHLNFKNSQAKRNGYKSAAHMAEAKNKAAEEEQCRVKISKTEEGHLVEAIKCLGEAAVRDK